MTAIPSWLPAETSVSRSWGFISPWVVQLAAWAARGAKSKAVPRAVATQAGRRLSAEVQSLARWRIGEASSPPTAHRQAVNACVIGQCERSRVTDSLVHRAGTDWSHAGKRTFGRGGR